jgi:hypothetical protein
LYGPDALKIQSTSRTLDRRAPLGEVRMKKVLLDLNVVLDLLLDRSPWAADASTV